MFRFESTWHREALCAQMGGDALFGWEGEKSRSIVLVYQQARKICARCPVQNECLEEALELQGNRAQQHRYGMWGGLTPGERTEISKKRRSVGGR